MHKDECFKLTILVFFKNICRHWLWNLLISQSSLELSSCFILGRYLEFTLNSDSWMNIFSWQDFKSIIWDRTPCFLLITYSYQFLQDKYSDFLSNVLLFWALHLLPAICTNIWWYVFKRDLDVSLSFTVYWRSWLIETMVVLSNIALFYVNYQLLLLCIVWRKNN